MSELKAFNCVESDLQEFCDPRLVYLKDEADKVIAELEERIADGDKDFEMADHQNERLLKIIQHHKYRRCLAMAERCRLEQERIELIENQDITDDDFNKLVKGFYKKWHKRWIAIAEKFKEAK